MHPDHWPKCEWVKEGPETIPSQMAAVPRLGTTSTTREVKKNKCQAVFSSNQLISNSKKVLQSKVSSSFKLRLLVINKETTTEEEAEGYASRALLHTCSFLWPDSTREKT